MYGCVAPLKSFAVVHVSTARPAYMTITRSAKPATMPRSCVISSTATRRSAAERLQQVEHLRLNA